MLGGLDKPSAGNLYVDGKDLLKFTDKDYMEYKRNTVGFVWQNNARNLVPYLTAVQNVELPMLLNGEHKRRQKALELLDRVGLLKRKNFPSLTNYFRKDKTVPQKMSRSVRSETPKLGIATTKEAIPLECH